jgi:predicted MFS family arabinose efflux permease
MMGLGIGLGPITGGVLIVNFSWPAVFLVNVPVVIAALALGLYLVPDSRDPEHAALDLVGAALSTAAVLALVYGIIDAPRTGWTDPVILGAFALAAVLAAAFGWRELHTSRPMLDFGLFRNRRMTFGVTAVGAAFFGLFSVIFGLTQYLQYVLDKSPLEAGEIMLPLAIGIPIGAGLSVRLVRRLGTRRVVSVALVLVAAVIGSVSTWTVSTEGWVVALALICAAIPMANVMAPSVDAILGAVREDRAGVGSAVNLLIGQLAGALGVAVVGSVMNTVYGDRMADFVAKLPPQIGGPASDSVGAAISIAAKQGGAAGQALAGAARTAFTDALGTGAIVAAGVIVVGAVLVALFMPARPLPRAGS